MTSFKTFFSRVEDEYLLNEWKTACKSPKEIEADFNSKFDKKYTYKRLSSRVSLMRRKGVKIPIRKKKPVEKIYNLKQINYMREELIKSERPYSSIAESFCEMFGFVNSGKVTQRLYATRKQLIDEGVIPNKPYIASQESCGLVEKMSREVTDLDAELLRLRAKPIIMASIVDILSEQFNILLTEPILNKKIRRLKYILGGLPARPPISKKDASLQRSALKQFKKPEDIMANANFSDNVIDHDKRKYEPDYQYKISSSSNFDGAVMGIL